MNREPHKENAQVESSSVQVGGSTTWHVKHNNYKQWCIFSPDGRWTMQPVGMISADEARDICERAVGNAEPHVYPTSGACSYPSDAYARGAEVERKAWIDHIDTLIESLLEGLMTDSDLDEIDRLKMSADRST